MYTRYREEYFSGYRNDSGGQKRKNDFGYDYDRSYKRPFGRSYDHHKRRRSPSSSGSSSSVNDDIGHYHGRVGSVIKNRYTIIKELGKGTFGSVFKCKDSKHNDHVALKIIRNIPRYVDSAKIESDILDDVFEKQNSTGVDLCVNMYSRFRHEDYYCMVFETLGVSLYDLVKKNNYKRFPLACVRDIAKQLLQALGFLKSINLIHTDLKLENVLFTHNTLRKVEVEQYGHTYTVEVPVNTSIKLIDFGGATYANDKSKSRIINTRQYRGPEVTLELGWSFPSDMWSAGCILAEVYSGDLLFQTHDELEHLAMMEQALENFPRQMADKSKHAHKFFNRRGQVRREDLPSDSRRVVDKLPSLKNFFGLSPEDGSSGIVELVRGMLRVDPTKRLQPQQALELPFIATSATVAETKQEGNSSSSTTISTLPSSVEVIQPTTSTTTTSSNGNGHISSDSLNTPTAVDS